ncbi:tuberin isoform X3 [Folsomia candida]|nr:tuberin isoform X3 [Folsomia candida]
MTALVQAQMEKTGVIRAKLFVFIKGHENPEDIYKKFQLLQSLTMNGKDLEYFEERLGPLLHDWIFHKQIGNIPMIAFLGFVVNVIKYNNTFLDQDILSEIIQNVCVINCISESLPHTVECLKLFEAVLSYGRLPIDCLTNFLITLCHTINVDSLTETCSKVTKNLLGTHLGNSAIHTMCGFMESSDERFDNETLVRGAVVLVGTSLWGVKFIRGLKYSFNLVLQSFDKALDKKHKKATYEVQLRIQELVQSNCDVLTTVTWDLILQITSRILSFAKTDCKDDPHNYVKIMTAVNNTLDAIEAILFTKSFCGEVEQFFDLVDSCYLSRPIGSVEKLMQYKASTQLHTAKAEWFESLVTFTEKHLRFEVRPAVKAKAMPIITKICLMNRDIYEEDLIVKVILPSMKNLENENDPNVRVSGVNFLVDFLMESSSKKGHDLLHILDKIINRPYEIHAQTGSDTVHIYSESEVDDIVRAVEGIVKLFKRKIYHLPSSIAVSAYKSLVKHMGNHYKKPAVLDICYKIRYKIFDCFFAIRANSLYHLGFPLEGAKLTYSSYLAVDHRDGDEKMILDQQEIGQQITVSSVGGGSGVGGGSMMPGTSSSFQSSCVTFISLTAACKLVVGSLKKEKDWNVLELVLRSLPSVLENKALILSKNGNDIDYLGNALCNMIMDKSLNLPESLKNCPVTSKLTKTDFQAYLYPIFTALVSYHSFLDSTTQQKIVMCLKQGVASKICRMCILALTVCTLEMKDTMHKLLPDVLLAVSKITPRFDIAIPVLEFLSTLIHLPRVFASFVDVQYMSIFAIALPYTNPFKFNQYTVSLAHHVIALWFLKCRFSFRRQFVGFIIKGLESNVWGPLEEGNRRYESSLGLQNEDSSNRKRSSSLTDRRQTDQRRERPISGHTQAVVGQRLTSFDSKDAADKSLQTFHHELTETCLDFMMRYAFADCSALPTRFPTTNFLVEGGISQSWLIDNRIITITTSGCSQKELKDGVCDKCFLICRKQKSLEDSKRASHDATATPALSRSLSVRTTTTTSGSQNQSNLARRRHVSAFAGAGAYQKYPQTGDSGKPGINDCSVGGVEDRKTEMKDDLQLENKLINHGADGEEGNIGSGLLGGSSPFISEYSHKTKSETFLCSCWCAGWAEILIRSPTGNTSWMMRVQNHTGNNNTAGIPYKDLSSIYLQNVVEPCQADNFMSSTTSSTLSSPTHGQQPLLISQTSVSQDSVLAGSGGTISPTPGTPTTPDSPGADGDNIRRKNPVCRSNSSPEMSSSTWKSSHMTLQKDIEEQDEEEIMSVVTFASPLIKSSKQSFPNSESSQEGAFQTSSVQSNSQSQQQSTSPKERKDTNKELPPPMNPIGPGIKGTTSPFRRSYEAIPEENTQQHQRSGSLTGSPEALKPEIIGPIKRDRVSTISVMMPAARNQFRRMLSLGNGESVSRDARAGGQPESGVRSGVTPGFVFLQLCSQGIVGKGERPILLPSEESTAKSLRVLDYIPPYETHKIGVVYVGPSQSKNETAIFQNLYGSSRYRDFLQGLGSLIKLKEIDPQKNYMGGLSKDGDDGDFASIWQDDVMQVIFHVATLMPNKVNDPQGNCKKRHIGNDYVTIVYNNSDEEFDISTIKAQFLYAWVIIQPLDHRTNRVVVKSALPILADHIGHSEAKIVSDQNLPIMARQLALHANLASVIYQKMQAKNADPYASNWLERLRHIKRLRSRLFPDSGLSSSEELSNEAPLLPITSMKRLFEDFTEFV